MNKVGIGAVIVMILTSILGVRWIPVAGSIGPSAIILWVLGALLFFIPLSLIVIDLSSNFSADGGVYLWVRESLGERFGFFTAWLYWVNNLFFYPSLLVFMVANLAYLIGNKALAGNQQFVLLWVVIFMWLAILINIMGVRFIAKIAAMSCALNIGLVLFIIIGGAFAIFHHKSATVFTWGSLLPNATMGNNLSNLTLLMFGLSGIELIPTMANSIKNPQVNLRRGVIISGFVVMLSYIIGTITINAILSPAELNNTTGLMEALISLSIKMHAEFLAVILVIVLLLIEFGALIVWLIAPTVMFFECAPSGILPGWMQKLNKHNIPANALILIGIIVTGIVALTQYLPTVNSIFTTLVLMGTIVYFLPYLFLAVGYIKLRRFNLLPTPIISTKLAYICSILLFVSVVLGLLLSFAPSSDFKTTMDIIIYEVELVLGPLLFMGIGYIVYNNHYNKKS